jgi:hypothetical protein
MVDVRAQIAENLKIVFRPSKKGGYWQYRLSHENLVAYTQGFEQYLQQKDHEREWRKDHPEDTDSGHKRMMDLWARDLDEVDYLFTLKTKLWLFSLIEDERRDMKPLLDQLNNDAFWKNLFNWRRMEKVAEDSQSTPPHQ